jgi:putative spermidine/putrescine transport system permease protein
MASVQHTGRSRLTRTSAFFFRHPRLKLVFALLPPVAWMVVIYLASLSVLLATAFWSQDELSGKIIHSFTLDNFKQIWQDPVNRTIIMRTLLTALAVTAIDIVLAFPLAYYMARVASRHLRALLIIGILMPLWSSYLIKVYTWRLITAQDGALNWALGKVGLGPIHIAYTQTAVVIVFVYLWLPYMVLPIYAALERIPNSVLEASGDLGARAWPTFRRVVLPPARRGGRLDLHLLADPGRLHRPRPDRGRPPVHRQRDLLLPGPGQRPAVRGGDDVRADRDHHRLPAAREAARRIRGAMTIDSTSCGADPMEPTV